MNSTFGEKLKKIRLERNLSQDELAMLLGTSKQVISRYENNQRTPKINIANEYAQKLSVSLNYLIDNGILELPSNAIPFTPPAGYAPILGSIPAGYPVLVTEQVEGYAPVDVACPENYFWLRVQGDSMLNAGIKPGDLVLIKQQPCADDGQIVACRLNGDEATLKRIKKQGSNVLLLPENPDYNPSIVPAADFDSGYASIIGVAVEIRRTLI